MALVLKPADKDPGGRTLEASIALGAGDPEGLYAVHVWTGDQRSPQGIGKGWFLRGRLVVDYPIMSLVDPKRPEADIRAYLEDFHLARRQLPHRPRPRWIAQAGLLPLRDRPQRGPARLARATTSRRSCGRPTAWASPACSPSPGT
ncbi:MAG: hypothetical protein MZV64_10680 [Ignavibacteriales bacterium]|nr:hypothetical protein [Ignavibacteriales bacterium]